MRHPKLLLLSAFTWVGFLACVSNEPGSDDSTGSDASTDGSVGNDTSSNQDGPLTCSGTLTACGGSCVDLTNNDGNCGKCGHSCLGDGCDNSQCKPADLMSGLNFPTSIATSAGTDQIVVNTNSVIERCAKTGCGGVGIPEWNDGTITTTQASPVEISNAVANVPTFGTLVFQSDAPTTPRFLDLAISSPTTPNPHDMRFADNLIAMAGDPVTVGGDALVMDGYGIYLCQNGDCNNSPTVAVEFVGDNDEQAAAIQVGTPGNLVWASETTVATCALDSADAASPICPWANLYNSATTDTDASIGIIQHLLTATSTTAFWVAKVNGTSFAIESCPSPGGCTNPKLLVAGESAIDSFAVDASGIFWTDKQGGRLRACLDVNNGCGTSSVTVLSNLAQPSGVAIDSTYVFFTQAGVSAGQGKVSRLVR